MRPVKRDRTLFVVAACAVANAVALIPWLFTPGSPEDEGGILAYARLALQGYVPMRDVRSFYGPLNSYFVGGVLWLADWNLYAERLIGLVYRLVIAISIMLLVRKRGSVVVALCGLTFTVLPPTVSLTASAALGALAASALAILLASHKRAGWAGVAGGIAVLMRFDWILPIVLCAIPWIRVWDRRARLRFAGGFAAAAGLYLPYLAAVGWANIRYGGKILDVSQTAHRMPIPGLDTSAGMILVLTLVAVPVLFFTGMLRSRSVEGSSFQSIAWFSLGLFPYALYAPSRTHVLMAGLLALATVAAVPAALVEQLLRKVVRRKVGLSFAVTLAIVVPVLLLSLATLEPAPGYAATVNGRSFIMPTAASADAAELAVRDAGRLAPRDGSLFVGPRDLASPSASDAYMYYLLPQLKPASFFVVLDPGITELAPHDLADSLPHASVLILDDFTYWPTGTARNATDRVVSRDFCVRSRFDQFVVYTRCDKA